MIEVNFESLDMGRDGKKLAHSRGVGQFPGIAYPADRVGGGGGGWATRN